MILKFGKFLLKEFEIDASAKRFEPTQVKHLSGALL